MADFTLVSENSIKLLIGSVEVPGLPTTVNGYLFFLSGIAGGSWPGAVDGWNGTKVHFDVPFPDGRAYRYINWAPTVAPTSIGSDAATAQFGWAVDDFRIIRTDESTRFVYMEVDVNALGGGTAIWRLAYNIQVLAYLG